MGTQEQILEEMKRRQQLEQLRRDQKRHNIINTVDNAANKLQALPKTIDRAKNTISFGKNLYNGIKAGETLGNAIKGAQAMNNAAKVANTATTATNAANTASTAANAANTASTAANTANAASTLASGAAKAMPVVGAVAGGASAANNFAKGNHVDGALDIAKTGAMFIPGVGWAVAGAIQIGQMIKDAIKKRQQEKIAKSQEQTNKVMQQAEQNKQENISQFDDNALANNTMAQPMGQFGQGNIDLTNRPVVQNQDGTISTVRSMSFNDGTNEILIPTVSNDGRIMSPDEAIAEYDRTGQHLGKFATPEEATRYAESLHNQQDQMYSGTPKGQVTGAASSVNQGYVGTLPVIPKPTTPEVQPTEEVAQEPSWGQNILDAMNAAQGLGASKDVIDAIPQGLNSGNKDIAALIDKYTINKPTTPEEVELARKGEFNKPEQQVEEQVEEGTATGAEPTVSKDTIIANMMKNIRGGLNNFAEGYKDNAYTSFSEGDLAQGLTTGAAANVKPKTFLNRVGEAVGTGSRLIANPALQGLVAGTVKGINSGDFGTGLEYGVNWAANKAKSDNYYKRMNPDAKRAPIFSNYDSKDYNAYTLDNYRTLNANKNMQSATALANAMLGAGRWTEEEAQNFIDANGAETLIPTNVFNYLLKDNQAENKITADMTKHSDNHGETVRHNKETENIGKTNAGANVTRAGAYVKKVDNEVEGDDKYYPGGKSVTKTGKMVRVLAPDKKTVRFIPEEQLEAAINAGGTLL